MGVMVGPGPLRGCLHIGGILLAGAVALLVQLALALTTPGALGTRGASLNTQRGIAVGRLQLPVSQQAHPSAVLPHFHM